MPKKKDRTGVRIAQVKKFQNSVVKYGESLGYKSWDKVKEGVKEHFNDHSEKELKNIINKAHRYTGESIERGIAPKRSEYYLPVFSSSPGCWYHDILDNTKEGKPRYWYLFLGVNNHYGKAYPLEERSVSAIKPILLTFIQNYKPLKLMSDKERAIASNEITKMMDDHNVQYKLINSKYYNHVGLGLLDRFCRTIREINHTLNNANKTSVDDTIVNKEPINDERMQKILRIYNNSEQKRIGCSPAEMFGDGSGLLEKDYIFKHLKWKEEGYPQKEPKVRYTHNKPTKVIEEGNYARYWKPADFRHHNDYPSEGVYKVISAQDGWYTLEAKDGTTKEFTRQQLLLANDRKTVTVGKKWGAHFNAEGKPGRPKAIPQTVVQPTQMVTRSRAQAQVQNQQRKRRGRPKRN